MVTPFSRGFSLRFGIKVNLKFIDHLLGVENRCRRAISD
jgi:hypothetical protein